MSLVIFVSSQKVIISKYQLEFSFSAPPQNLTNAAKGAYQLLRQSEVIQIESSRDEREEAMTLLRHYGRALFQSITPNSYKSQVTKAGGLFIYSVDPEIINLPWELLYDGSSFFALTQGVVRINDAKTNSQVTVSERQQSYLKVSLNSYSPLRNITHGNRFITYVEELVSENINKSPLLKLSVDGNASRQSILQTFKQSPDLFLFSGHDSVEGWVLKDDTAPNHNKWLAREFQPAFKKAIKNGTRILILLTSSLFEDPDKFSANLLTQYFDLGIPYIISIHGRIARHRFQEYFQNFISNLLREENILRAHRHAVNSIQASLPLSWDWSWIQLNLNKNLLEQTLESPLPPYRFRSGLDKKEDFGPPIKNQILNYRRFSGNLDILRRINDALIRQDNTKIVRIYSSDGMLLDEYLQEFMRRLSSDQVYHLSLLYYFHWGFHKPQKEKLPTTDIGNLFSFFLDNKQIKEFFEQSLIKISSPEKKKSNHKFLIVYYPPERVDTVFDSWVKKKQADGWKIIFLSDGSDSTRLPNIKIKTDAISSLELKNSFEDEFPEQWIDLLEGKLPSQFGNLVLLKIVQRFGQEKLINLFRKKKDSRLLWTAAFKQILSSFAAQQMKIFVTLYLLRIKCSKSYLEELWTGKNFKSDLVYLQQLHLIDSNLEFTHFWISSNIYYQINRYQLIPPQHISSVGQELLLGMIVAFRGNQVPLISWILGFQYCVSLLVELAPIENPLQRNLQLGKKLSRYGSTSFSLYYPIVSTCLEIALKTGKKKLLQKTLFSVMEIIENLPLEQYTIRIYKWLLQAEEKQRNWLLVSEILMKLALVYVKLNKKEKAIGLITSAIQLNNDIKNFASRSQNLITIALLLLELEEFEKVRKLISNADFDLKRLNEKEINKLWLIDGHLLHHEKKYDAAEKSFLKIFNSQTLIVSESLMAKTYIKLSEIYQRRNDAKRYQECLNNASRFFELSGSLKHATELHETLSELYLSAERTEKAIDHLEWLYNTAKQTGDLDRTRNIADQLGGLYFRIGDKIKSTNYYSIAQGI